MARANVASGVHGHLSSLLNHCFENKLFTFLGGMGRDTGIVSYFLRLAPRVATHSIGDLFYDSAQLFFRGRNGSGDTRGHSSRASVSIESIDLFF